MVDKKLWQRGLWRLKSRRRGRWKIPWQNLEEYTARTGGEQH